MSEASNRCVVTFVQDIYDANSGKVKTPKHVGLVV